MASKKKKQKKKKISPDERKAKKIRSDHQKLVRSIFKNTGFKRIIRLSDKEFSYKGQKTDFDDFFIFENIIVCAEYTTSAPSNVGIHLKNKKIVYDKIQKNIPDFVDFLFNLSGNVREILEKKYHSSEIVVKIIYCSRLDFDKSYKANVPNPVYMDYAIARYFKSTSDCIKASARHELIDFLGVHPGSLGENGQIKASGQTDKFSGSLLPEANSNFASGFKVVSFYIDGEALLKRAYVLRRGGWRDSHNLYQRLILKAKIESIRRYLKKEKRVFVNNIIATLSEHTKIVDSKGNTVDAAKINSIKPVSIQIPGDVNSIGIVDGQHRTYSYYEAVPDDGDIAILRKKQNLLLTGIIYPQGISDVDREKFEARLFLEINSNQTNARSNLKQEIGLVLEPFSEESIATRVMRELDLSGGPLSSHVERFWFDKNKLKTTSIVRYGLKPLVKTSGDDSLFAIWNEAGKEHMVIEQNQSLLDLYIKFCVAQINQLLSAVKNNLAADKWTPEKNVKGRMITTTNVNSFLICLRILIVNKKSKGFSFYNLKLKNISSFKFSEYHSSQYNRLAESLYKTFF